MRRSPQCRGVCAGVGPTWHPEHGNKVRCDMPLWCGSLQASCAALVVQRGAAGFQGSLPLGGGTGHISRSRPQQRTHNGRQAVLLCAVRHPTDSDLSRLSGQRRGHVPGICPRVGRGVAGEVPSAASWPHQVSSRSCPVSGDTASVSARCSRRSAGRARSAGRSRSGPPRQTSTRMRARLGPLRARSTRQGRRGEPTAV
jgi:hypothetical protein